MKVRFFDIEWEAEDADGKPLSATELGLPTDLVLEVDDEDFDFENFCEAGADYLSDHFGWLVRKFDITAEGKCPSCGADLDYQEGEVQDHTYVYKVHCTECDWAGKECYDLVFSSQEL